MLNVNLALYLTFAASSSSNSSYRNMCASHQIKIGDMRNISNANVNQNRKTPTPHANWLNAVFFALFCSVCLPGWLGPFGHKFLVTEFSLSEFDSILVRHFFIARALPLSMSTILCLSHCYSPTLSFVFGNKDIAKNQPVCLSTQLTACFQCILFLFFPFLFFRLLSVLGSRSGFWQAFAMYIFVCEISSS